MGVLPRPLKTPVLKVIDTHTHIDAEVFDADRDALVKKAKEKGLVDALICSGIPGTFDKTRQIAHELGFHYALGVHPLYIEKIDSVDTFLKGFEETIKEALTDPLFAGIGEIGLDGFVKDLDQEKMLTLFREQLRLARRFSLPVSIHARHAVDAVSREIAVFSPLKGIVHAFNGSENQAQRLIGLGMKLGFGGALTYEGSKRIRRIFVGIANEDFVLETDAPDMPGVLRRAKLDARTHPADIFETLEVGAALRGLSLESLAAYAFENAQEAFSRLKEAH